MRRVFIQCTQNRRKNVSFTFKRNFFLNRVCFFAAKEIFKSLMFLQFFLEMAPEKKNRKGMKPHPYKKEEGAKEYNPNRYCNKCGQLVLGFVKAKVNYCGTCGANFKTRIVGMVECKNCRNLLIGMLKIFFEYLSFLKFAYRTLIFTRF